MVSRQNAVNQVLNDVGKVCFKPCPATTVGGLLANAKQIASNMETTINVAGAFSHMQPASNDPTFSSPQTGGWGGSGFGTIAMTGLGIAVGIANPALGAVIGAMAIPAEIATFAVGHAGVKGSAPAGGELTLNNSYARFDQKSGDLSSYQAACDGMTYDVASGQAQKPVLPQPIANPLMAGLTQVSETMSQEDIGKDIMAKFRDQMKQMGQTQYALANRHDMELEGPSLDPAEESMRQLTEHKPKVIAPKVGMMGMGMPSLG